MVEIESFLKGVDGRFIRVEACRASPPDIDYIEGAIRLSVDGVEMIGTTEWDYVDQLWCYIAEMVEKLKRSGYAETYFPDQPIMLSFRSVGHRVLLVAKIGEEVRAAYATYTDLVDVVNSAGVAFFDRMSELAPGNSYTEARKQLSA
ncbi:hypothetical protein [Marinactinospora rubrisoli]|uniref:Uncharacterized protein n=1 Tax=Marinactinospora rubrisoli TaxID=2715399 RepID=A0ABW2KIU7_9ACTN